MVQVPAEDMDHWSEVVHEKLGGCGGFIDVTHETIAGVAPLTLALREVRLQTERQADDGAEDIFRFTGTEEIAQLTEGATSTDLWKSLSDVTAFPDRSATTENGKQAALWLAKRATELAGHLPGFSVMEVATETPLYSKQPSIVATIPGTDPTLPGVLIGAHMDTFSPGRPGADDDGSGTAVLLEALRVIGQQNAKFKRTIHVAWYSAEERGLIGSSFVVKRFKKDGIKVHAAMQLDMVGYNSDEEDFDVYLITDNVNVGLTNTLRKIAETYADAKVSETQCGYACSDHANWHRAGVPVAYPFEASFENHNQRLHTAQDKMDFLDPIHAVRYARIALGFFGELAELEMP